MFWHAKATKNVHLNTSIDFCDDYTQIKKAIVCIYYPNRKRYLTTKYKITTCAESEVY